MTNSELLQRITELRTEIDEQTNLCASIFKLDNVESGSVKELSDSIISKIDQFKKYQAIINKRNIHKILIYQNTDYAAIDLIKIKEGILLKKQLKQLLISTNSEQDKMLQISLEAFQSIQDYKKSLSEIHIILQEFNDEKFDIKEY